MVNPVILLVSGNYTQLRYVGHQGGSIPRELKRPKGELIYYKIVACKKFILAKLSYLIFSQPTGIKQT